MKTRQFLIFLVAILIFSHVQSGEMPGSDVRAEIYALDDAWIKAEVERDQAALEDILDEQFLVTYSSGKTVDRAAFISGIMKSDLEPFEVIHEEIRIHGNTVVVVDSTTDKKIKFIWVAVRKGESWKVISEVASKVAEAK